MKKTSRDIAFKGLVLLGTLSVIGGCKQDNQKKTEPSSEPGLASVAPAEEKSEKALFDVEGMTCASCDVTVKMAAEKVDGVHAARASFAKQQAQVKFDPDRTTPLLIAQAITAAGYPSKLVGAETVNDTKPKAAEGANEAGVETHVGVGVVKGILDDGAKLVLDHEEIPGWMKAMEMSFDVKDPKLSASVAMEDKIRFTVETDDDGYRITDIKKID